MDRTTVLAQAATIAFLVSTVTALGYRGGGRRRFWLASGLSLVLLEAILVWSWMSSPGEGPLWVTIVGVIPPLLLVSFAVESMARKRMPFAVQIAGGAAAGLVGYIVTAFVAYAGSGIVQNFF